MDSIKSGTQWLCAREKNITKEKYETFIIDCMKLSNRQKYQNTSSNNTKMLAESSVCLLCVLFELFRLW